MLAGYSKTDHTHSGYATTTQLNAKLTASKMTNIPNSTATDVAGAVADINKILAGLKAAGIML
ncbi:Head fiber protein [Bacillus anthracis]|nr:Head fiber protein [Bacillus anthracis]